MCLGFQVFLCFFSAQFILAEITVCKSLSSSCLFSAGVLAKQKRFSIARLGEGPVLTFDIRPAATSRSVTCVRAGAQGCRDVLFKWLGLAVELVSPSLLGFIWFSLVLKFRSAVWIRWELELGYIELAWDTVQAKLCFLWPRYVFFLLSRSKLACSVVLLRKLLINSLLLRNQPLQLAPPVWCYIMELEFLLIALWQWYRSL